MSKTQIPTGGITDGTLTSAKLDQDGAFVFNEGSADVDLSRLRDDIGDGRLSVCVRLSLLKFKNERTYRVFFERVAA